MCLRHPEFFAVAPALKSNPGGLRRKLKDVLDFFGDLSLHRRVISVRLVAIRDELPSGSGLKVLGSPIPLVVVDVRILSIRLGDGFVDPLAEYAAVDSQCIDFPGLPPLPASLIWAETVADRRINALFTPWRPSEAMRSTMCSHSAIET